MKTKRFVSTLLALLLICSLPLSAFAEEYDLATGSITVTANEGGQYVTQENGVTNEQQTTPTVITQSDSSNPTENTVTITATENAAANVTIQDVNIVISDPNDGSGKAAVTIDVADNAAANVTLDGVNIDTKNTGGIFTNPLTGGPLYITGEAAVQIVGNGDVTLELDGENTVQGGYDRAGVEKNTTAATDTEPANGTGKLTITDENGTSGSLEATGGYDASGIGGGKKGDGSNITISGSAEVTAKGGDSGAGIGGGCWGSGSNITINGSAEVTATGGEYGSGIGGGFEGSGSDITISGSAEVIAKGGDGGSGIGGGSLGEGITITITGNAKVTATGGEDGSGIGGGLERSGSNITIEGSAEVTTKGGDGGSGIGGGLSGSGSDITVSGDAQVKAQGGNQYSELGKNYRSAGAAIGNGGEQKYGAVPNPGDEVEPNTDVLTTNGKIEYYAPGANMETESPYKTVTGTYVPPQDEEKPPVDEEKPDQSAEESAAEAVYTAPLYRVIDQDGKDILHQDARKDGVLTITVDADFAALTGKLGGIQTLKAQGVDTIVFVTNGAASTFALSDLLSQGSTGDTYTLTHDGDAVSFILNNGADAGSILQ